MDMNERIRLLRKHFDLTQEKFAERIGLKQNTIALIESGKRNTSDQTVIAICREFGVSEDWLRNGTGEMFANCSRSEQVAAFFKDVEIDDGFKSRFISLLADLNEDEWIALESVVNAIRQRHVFDADTSVLPAASTAELEEQYKKEILHSAAGTDSSASSSTAEHAG